MFGCCILERKTPEQMFSSPQMMYFVPHFLIFFFSCLSFLFLSEIQGIDSIMKQAMALGANLFYASHMLEKCSKNCISEEHKFLLTFKSS